MGSKKVWIVGARDTCDIVIDQPTVSGEHCRLEFDDGRVFLEDLQSTNGTYVNGERIYERKQIHPDALVTLGKSVTMPMPSQLTAPAKPASRPQAVGNPSDGVEESAFPMHLVIASGAAAAVLLLVVVVAIVMWGGDPETAQIIAKGQEITETEESTSLASSNSEARKNAPQENLPPAKPEDSIYVVAVATEDQSQIYRIGTGVAVGPHSVLTTGTVHMISTLLSEQFPKVVLLSQGEHPTTIESFTPHATYVSAFQEAEEAKAKFDQIYSRIDTNGMDDLSSDLQKSLEDAYGHFMVIAEKPNHYDIAVIQVSRTLPNWLPIAESSALTPLERLTLIGHGFDRVAPYYPPDAPLPVSKITTRVQKTSGSSGNAANARLAVMKFDSQDYASDHLDTNWNGSPLLNSQGKLVAIYSRPTPELTLGTPPSGETFDAAVLSDLQSSIRQMTKH
ncbi:FHA domain-containing protein [Blastopirellula marina]|nr:FHA domain-containing protein [Blastopirellula marina]